MSNRLPSRHRRTGSSSDLYHLVRSPPRQSVKDTSSNSCYGLTMAKMSKVSGLIKASVVKQEDKVTLVQTLQANYQPNHLQQMEFGRNHHNRGRRHKSQLDTLALFSIPEANSTLDSLKALENQMHRDNRKDVVQMNKKQVLRPAKLIHNERAAQVKSPTLKTASTFSKLHTTKYGFLSQTCSSMNKKKLLAHKF